MIYRYTFYNIPYMRGGVDVPALNSGDVAETQLEKYFIMEIFSQRQFSEEQVQLVFSEGESLSASQANYMRVSKTQNTTQKDYSTDSNVSFWWVDDVQLLGAINAAGDLAARVTISPDVWLTDFFAAESDPKISGRVAQTTLYVPGAEKNLNIKYNSSTSNPPITVPVLNKDNIRYSIIAIYSTNEGELLSVCSKSEDSYTAEEAASNSIYFSNASKILNTAAEEIEYTVKVIRMYVLPNTWISNIRSSSIYKITTSGGATLEVSGIEITQDFESVQTLFKPTEFDRVPGEIVFLCTPGRSIQLTEILTSPNGAPALGFVYINFSGHASDAIEILLYANGEMTDISTDFEIDFSTNESAVGMSQQKQSTMLKVISAAVGGASGAIGGITSGNFFGATSSVLTGAGSIVDLVEARRIPATPFSAGNAFNILQAIGPFYMVICEKANKEEVDKIIEKYGYIYPNAPYSEYQRNDLIDNFIIFSVLDVYGMTGGQSAAIEISNAFLRGVRLKTL